MRISLVCLLVALTCVPARASPNCMLLSEARAAHPGKYLTYRLDRGKQCWNDHGPIHRPVVKHRGIPQTPPPVPVPRSTVLWPALASVAIAVDAALFTTEPATRWPLLLDVDELTAEPLAECCWPPLEPPFVERWAALTLPRIPIMTGGMK